MKGYKGFSNGLVCRGKQYAENTVFEEENAEICRSGMHFCANPLDVLDYYQLLNNNAELNDFCEVEAYDDPVTDDNKKFATKKLKIGGKLSFSAFVKSAIDFVYERTKAENESGYDAQLASSGYGAKLASSGKYAKLASSGYGAQLASSGDGAKLASSGYGAQLASSGDDAQLASSGYGAKLASSGKYAKLASSGYGAQLASSGDGAQLASSGYNSVLCGIGHNNIAQAAKGSWITLAEYDNDGGVKLVKTRKVDGKHIKANTWYKLVNGKFTEV